MHPLLTEEIDNGLEQSEEHLVEAFRNIGSQGIRPLNESESIQYAKRNLIETNDDF